jgi:hypothetical protein
MQLLLEAQQHKKYAQTTPLHDGVSSLFILGVFFSSFFLYFDGLDLLVEQGRTGHSGNAMLVAGAFTISQTKCLKRGLLKELVGLLDFFVWNFTGAL